MDDVTFLSCAICPRQADVGGVVRKGADEIKEESDTTKDRTPVGIPEGLSFITAVL